MKTLIIASASVLGYLLHFSNLIAQSVSADIPIAAVIKSTPIISIESGNIRQALVRERKPGIVEIAALKSVSKAEEAGIKVSRFLYKNFQTNVNPVWSFKDDVFTATVQEDNMSTTVFFTKKGNWLRSVKIYRQSQLLSGIKYLVLNKYPSFNIVSVQEVKERDEKHSCYYIRIEDVACYKDVQVYARKVDLYHEVKKK